MDTKLWILVMTIASMASLSSQGITAWPFATATTTTTTPAYDNYDNSYNNYDYNNNVTSLKPEKDNLFSSIPGFESTKLVLDQNKQALEAHKNKLVMDQNKLIQDFNNKFNLTNNKNVKPNKPGTVENPIYKLSPPTIEVPPQINYNNPGYNNYNNNNNNNYNKPNLPVQRPPISYRPVGNPVGPQYGNKNTNVTGYDVYRTLFGYNNNPDYNRGPNGPIYPGGPPLPVGPYGPNIHVPVGNPLQQYNGGNIPPIYGNVPIQHNVPYGNGPVPGQYRPNPPNNYGGNHGYGDAQIFNGNTEVPVYNSQSNTINGPNGPLYDRGNQYAGGENNYGMPSLAPIPTVDYSKYVEVVPYQEISQYMSPDNYNSYANMLYSAYNLQYTPPPNIFQSNNYSTPGYQKQSNNEFKMLVAVVVIDGHLGGPPTNIKGTLYMSEIYRNIVLVSGVIQNLKPNHKYGIAIHKYGDISNGCQSIGPHFNPQNSTHGNMNYPQSHAGDLGNIVGDVTGVAFVNKIVKSRISIEDNNAVAGRSFGICSQPDDLGLGGNIQSLIHGNCGQLIACGIIGYSNTLNSASISNQYGK
ncbi:probable inactive serine/threonine-protein kinase scy2 isoform X2 [Oppia nitens]|uniref:probable inactive serine/threonine-protein kinase scy2 isoform X2 n=1 Tax=Oppia nitens TaxID=1686743 RepID=UPI0023D9A5C0|nr:probable inactive serine/threonine-protein kinase scy2 isoform X2 [Oppia nitens]